MTTETLRSLSREYASGDIDREAYRAQRRELLEMIAAGTQPVVRYHPPEPEAPTVFPYEEDDGDTTQEILPTVTTSATQGGAGSSYTGVTVAIIVVLAGVLGWSGFTWYKNQSQAPAPIADTTVPPPAEMAPPSLLDNFLADNNWSPSSIEKLANAWQALGETRRDELQDSDAMRRMADAIVEQISGESALIDLGNAEDALDVQAELLELAEHLGIDNERLQRERAQWISRREARIDDKVAALGGAEQGVPFEPQLPDVSETAANDTTASATTPGESSGEVQAAAAEEDAPSDPDPESAAPAAATPAPESAPEPLPATLEPLPSPAAASAVAPTATAPGSVAAPAATRKAATRTNCKADLARTRRPYCIDILDSGEKGPVLVVLPPGEFQMGGSRDSEQPRHKISINYSIAIGLFEVSSAELQGFCSASGTACPAQPWSDPALPAVNVSWDLAQTYTRWLSEITGATYRLPSEAEWEYAVRAGSASAYPFGDELLPTHARYSFKNVEDTPLAANDRSVNRNDFRLYHMLGNVREWVLDGWNDNYSGTPVDGRAAAANADGRRVVRGGSYADGADDLRSAARTSVPGRDSDRYTGIRVVRVIEN